MKIAYFDCFSGISGDMCLGALVDLGLPLSDLSKALKGLRIAGFSLSRRRVRRGGLSATKVDVLIRDGMDRPMAFPEIRRLLQAARLPGAVRESSLQVFENLARSEAATHGTALAKVQFHELGIIDTLVDVVGTVVGCRLLGIEGIYNSAINVGSGTIESHHGTLPVPAPATVRLLQGLPIYARGPERELTTPTGAALMATLGSGAGAMPVMTMQAVGYGAGSFNPSDWPNVLRVLVGETSQPGESDRIMVLETNLDDMNPQAYELLMDRLLAQGALDVTLTPVIMKRSRPGIVLTVLADPAKVESVLRVMFAETTTLGVRLQEMSRRLLSREIVELSTRFGPVRIKVAKAAGRAQQLKARPEYRDCKRLAEQTGLPLRAIMREVERVMRRLPC
jgi:pyridinium-3,5-bisthiocarboxylic acid mononucleotide nickel chelatase